MAVNGSYDGSDAHWADTDEAKMAHASAVDWNASNFAATDMDYYWYQSGRGNDFGERRAGSLWMGDLEPYMDENFLRQAFSHMGEYFKYVKVMKNKFTGAFMGYCFVEFDNEETALRILHKLNGRIIPNTSPPKRFKLNHANYGKEHAYPREYSLFVGDLSLDVDDLGLYKAFSSRYPSVRAAKVVLDVTGRSKGFGFIRFTDEYEQQQALAQMQNYMGLGSKPLRVSPATQKRPLPGTPPATATTTTTTQQADYSRYYQSYDQYQNYYSSWQDYSQYYNYAGYNYNYGQYGYGSEYQQPAVATGADGSTEAVAEVAYDTTAMSGMTSAYDTITETSGDEAELPYFAEHDIPLDMDKENQECVQNNQEFYTALEDSRWTSLDYYRPLAIEAK